MNNSNQQSSINNKCDYILWQKHTISNDMTSNLLGGEAYVGIYWISDQSCYWSGIYD